MRRICGCIRWGLQFLSNRIRQSYRKNVIWKMIVRTRHPSPGIYIYLQKAKLKKVCWTSPRPGSIFGNSLGPNYVGNVVHCLRLNGRQIKTKTMRRAFWENAPIVLCIGHRNALIFLANEAQMIVNFLGYFEKPHSYAKTAFSTFRATFWKNWATFNPTSGHTVCDRRCNTML